MSENAKGGSGRTSFTGEQVNLDTPHPLYHERTANGHGAGGGGSYIYLGPGYCRELGIEASDSYRVEPHEDGFLITSEYSRNTRSLDTEGSPGGGGRHRLYELAVDTWGEEPQIDMVGEEGSELAAEVFRYWRGRADESDLAEEAADMEVMLEQLRLIIGDDAVDAAKEQKLERLETRLREAGADV